MNTYTNIYLLSVVLFIAVVEILTWGMINHWWLPFWQSNAIGFLLFDGVWLLAGGLHGFVENRFGKL